MLAQRIDDHGSGAVKLLAATGLSARMAQLLNRPGVSGPHPPGISGRFTRVRRTSLLPYGSWCTKDAPNSCRGARAAQRFREVQPDPQAGIIGT